MKKILLIISALVITAILSACHDEEDRVLKESSSFHKSVNTRGEQISLGRQLENSYSVENMRAAYRKLRRQGLIDSIESIDTTHLYIRFNPRDAEEVSMLVEDSTIDVFPYPLDYEIIGEGIYEPNPSDPTYLYAVVPVGFRYRLFSDYRILDYCHIPDIDNDPDLEILEQTALEMTGNWVDETVPSKCGHAPSGKIEVYNNATQRYEGLRNVHIVMNTLFRIRKATTDTAGNYSISTKFLTNVNYTIYFHNPNSSFQIWGNHYCLMPATSCLGVHSNNGYSYQIRESATKTWQWASLNNAVSIYKKQLCPSLNILPPPSNLRIAAYDLDFGNWSGCAPMLRHWSCASCSIDNFIDDLGVFLGSSGLLMLDRTVPDIIVLSFYNQTSKIYSNIFHELSHASHSVLVSGNYWATFCLSTLLNNQNGTYGTGDLSGYIGVGEMWAYFAEYVFTNYNIKNTWNGAIDTLKLDTLAKHDTIGDFWFKPHTLGDLIGPDRTYMRFDSIYRSLNATTINEFKNNLKTRITNYQPYVVDSIFAKHGF